MYLKKKNNIKRIVIFLSIFILFFSVATILFKSLKINKIFVPNELIGKKIPEFKSELFFKEYPINSNQIFKDKKYYLINIFASWCGPCRKEHPLLMKLSKEKKLEIVGINFKDNKKNAISFLENEGNPYSKIIKDEDGHLSIDIGSYGIPETILINKDKIIISKFVGPINLKDYKNIIKLVNSEPE